MSPGSSSLFRKFAFLSSLLILVGSTSASDFADMIYRSIDGTNLTLDAHVPKGPGPFSAAILVHGGGWVGGDKRQYITYLFQPLSDANFAWFTINYRLAPYHKFPANAHDVEEAIRWVKNNAPIYKVDINRIALIGESAGGHLVSYVGANHRPENNVAAIVSMYGIHDFITASIAWKPIPDEIMKLFGISSVDADSAPILVKASPVAYINKDMPPYLLIHGSKDADVPYQQSVEMCDKMKKAGANCELITVEGAPHGMDHWESHPEWLGYKKNLIDWLNKTLNAPAKK